MSTSSERNIWQVMGEEFHLESRFKVADYLGAGAYGVVCAVHDTVTQRSYAIKKCKNIFHSRTLAKRTLREIRFLRLMSHDNIIKIRGILYPQNDTTFDCLYLVFDLMETDLAQIIRSPQALKDQHVQYFTYQLMLSLQYLHSAGIVHRDLKPRNILVNSNCSLKVADFGLARLYNESNDTTVIAMTEYVTTRWYRAPEIIVGFPTYGTPIDMWAAGCIAGELLGRTPMFPGADSLKQLQLICNFLGNPPESFMKSCRKPMYKQYLQELDCNPIITLVELFPNANKDAINLISRLLQFTPNDRLSATDCLSLPYLTPMKPFFTKTQSPGSVESIESEFEFEKRKLTVDELRFELRREVLNANVTSTLANSLTSKFSQGAHYQTRRLGATKEIPKRRDKDPTKESQSMKLVPNGKEDGFKQTLEPRKEERIPNQYQAGSYSCLDRDIEGLEKRQSNNKSNRYCVQM